MVRTVGNQINGSLARVNGRALPGERDMSMQNQVSKSYVIGPSGRPMNLFNVLAVFGETRETIEWLLDVAANGADDADKEAIANVRLFLRIRMAGVSASIDLDDVITTLVRLEIALEDTFGAVKHRAPTLQPKNEKPSPLSLMPPSLFSAALAHIFDKAAKRVAEEATKGAAAKSDTSTGSTAA